MKNIEKPEGGVVSGHARGYKKWHPHRDSNPGYQDENLMS